MGMGCNRPFAGLQPAAALGLLGLAVFPAGAADHLNLEEGLPVEVEDAFPIAYRGRELQGLFRYERTDDHEDRFVLEPRVEVGFARNWQARIAVPFQLGSADRTGSGDVGLELFHNFNMETLTVPAFALSAHVDLPSGRNNDGLDTTLKFLATKTLGDSRLMQRLHLNVAWHHNAAARDNERTDRYTAILGYNVRVGPNAVLVADFVREQDRERGRNANILELGVRYQLTPLTVVAAGVGAGLGEESPDVRASLSFQHSLTWFDVPF